VPRQEPNSQTHDFAAKIKVMTTAVRDVLDSGQGEQAFLAIAPEALLWIAQNRSLLDIPMWGTDVLLDELSASY